MFVRSMFGTSGVCVLPSAEEIVSVAVDEVGVAAKYATDEPSYETSYV